MRNVSVKLVMSLLTVVIWLGSFPPSALADAPYKTYTLDHNGRYVRTQDAYFPLQSIEKVGDLEFKAPSDLHIDAADRIYVADTGNKRIVVIQPDGTQAAAFGQDVLNAPTGVYADGRGSIFVADGGAGFVFQFDEQGQLKAKFGRPDSPLYGKNSPFKPMKVTVDKRGNIYIVSEGTTNGVVQLSPYGDFLGYFGSNDSDVNLKIMLQRMLFTKEQRMKLFKNIPPTPVNISIDAKGLIYTVTPGDKGASIKKFNISGYNLLDTDMIFDPFFTDLFIAKSGNMYAVGQKGIIKEYDTEGNLLFSFGAPDDGKSRIGMFLNASGIAVDSKEQIFVLDKERNNIQIFEPTEFTQQVHQALELYKEGFYVKSQEPWNQVLRKNNLFDLAHRGLGDAYYKQQMYEAALDEYKIANDKEGYSDAYWEIRNRWLQENLLTSFFTLAGIYVLWRLLKWIHRRTGLFRPVVFVKNKITGLTLVKQLLFLFYFIKNPIDAYYGIKEEKKASVLSASILYIVFFAEYLLSLYYTGFIFNSVDFSEMQLSREIAVFFVPLAFWVISNYLISTINDGEGKFKDVYIGTIYALTPYLVFKPIVIVASNVLTINDAFLFSFSNTIIFAWSGLLLFLMVKELHDYTIRETIINILITLFGMLILSLVLFIVYVLLDQVFDFVYSVIREAAVRAEH
ncbi:YIP1 family protein [Paenibacillus thermotolerans]|uniref:YIP1 family protein n=1 Tax=Paenibacillus thermotolerans TaxID=3027807 RepID=UPI0023678B1F|nr:MULTISPECIES: YIP1 family protein [unclassified Paenibacillus]